MNVALDSILDAHGGLDYWRSLSSIDVEMSARGFLFRAKHVAPQRHVRLTVETRKPEAILHDYPAAGQRTVLRGSQRVETLDGAGGVLQTRDNPRGAFRHRRRSLYWDALDFAYFCGYAMWNYTNLPFLLTEPRVQPRRAMTMRYCQSMVFDPARASSPRAARSASSAAARAESSPMPR
jgi:hypothetical protein